MIGAAFLQAPVYRWHTGRMTSGREGFGMFLFELAALAGFVLALKAIFATRRIQAQLAGLAEQFSALDQRVVELAADVGLPRAAPTTEAPPPVALSPEEAPIVDEPAIPPEPIPTEPPAAPEEPVAAQPMPVPGRGWEQILVEHWLVWLGAAAMALGGVFLVKLSIDQGLLTPLVRVVLGILLGVGLSIGAERVRRHDLPADGDLDAASYIPQALAAAGAATVFASLYAAHPLYAFLPAAPAFLLPAPTAAAT